MYSQRMRFATVRGGGATVEVAFEFAPPRIFQGMVLLPVLESALSMPPVV